MTLPKPNKLCYNITMKITQAIYDKISHALPVQRGNVAIENLLFLNALLYICENGCKWRRLPSEYGNWNTVYVRYRRWVQNGIIERLFREFAAQKLSLIDFNALNASLKLDSMTVPVHPDAAGALKKEESKQ